MTEETTLTLSPWEQLRSLAEEEGKTPQEILHEAIFLLNRERLRQLDRSARREHTLMEGQSQTLPATWAREDLVRDAGLMEDLVTIYQVPQEWQALVESVRVQAEHPELDHTSD